jgi:predicted RNA-binding Zn ribbon-like protein
VTRFRFLGRLCLDFAATGGDGRSARFETLHATSDLARWMAESPLGVAVDVSGTDLALAKTLRRGIWNAAEALVDGGAPGETELAVINAVAARPPLVPNLTGPGLARGWREPSAEQALSDVARDAVALLSDPAQRARLRRCASPDCALIFYDSSRPGRRRWCSTERCGDRMRARAYRARHRA